MILIKKHCRVKREVEDGRRVLVMRRWPRGVAKTAVDAWEPDLAPSLQLLHRFRALPVATAPNPLARLDEPDWWKLIGDYLAEIAPLAAKIRALRDEHRSGATLTLLCSCHHSQMCHRRFLAIVIDGAPTSHGDRENDTTRLL